MSAAPADGEGIAAIGRSIDELVTTEVRLPGERSAGMVKALYAEANAREDTPLCLAAGRALVETIAPGDTVIIATGAGKGRTHLPRGETDGPLGAVALARALARGLGARPIITVEDHCIEPTIAALRAGGLNDLSFEELTERQNAAMVVEYPKDREAGARTAEEFFERYEPTAVIGIEKGSPNAAGVYHSANGADMEEGRAKIAPLFDRAAADGVLTVGIGDNGNEIGFGVIEDAVRKIQPFGAECGCPCGGGIAARVATDHLIVANVSNWGAHGLQAMLVILSDTPEAMHEPADVTRMLEQTVLAGSNDGAYDMPLLRVDGSSLTTQRGIVAILRDIVDLQLSEPYDRGF